MTFTKGWAFAELHMPAVRDGLGNLPMKLFLDIETASAKRDMQEATDLVLSVQGGDIAVRVRRNKFWERGKLFGYDLSIRAVNKGHKTEIHKLREGFGRWYFYGYSSDDAGRLIGWWLLDLDMIRQLKILDDESYPIYPNGDGTEGMYISLRDLKSKGCVIHEENLDQD